MITVALGVSPRAQTGGTTRLSGRAVDTGGNPLPGVTLTLTGNGVSATAVTDGTGRFQLDAFVISSAGYSLTASLVGFETTTPTRVRTVPGETTVLKDIVLRLGCAEVDLVVQRSLLADAREAALVAHVRVESIAAAREWRGEHSCVIAHEVTAWVEADAAQGARRQMRFLTRTRHAIERGDEYVAAFGWDPMHRRYVAFTLPVRVANGVATLDDQSVSEGLERQMGVDELLKRLR
jgi:hypothetical protein